MALRSWFAKAELASGIPGLARALAVKAWQARVAKQPIKTEQEVKAFIAQNPELCLKCINDDAAEISQSKARIDANIAKNWAKPKDYDGYIKIGSAGLLDQLASSFIWAGIHTGNYLPFVAAVDAKAIMTSYEGALGVGTYMVYRFLNGPYKVLVPGTNAPPETQDSRSTWGNIFSAYANPQAFNDQTPYAIQAKADYQARADEIGIDLAKVAYPWPPGKSYKDWTFKTFYTAFLSYVPKTVKNLPALAPFMQAPVAIKKVSITAGPLAGQLLTAASLSDQTVAPLVVMLHDWNSDDTQLFALAQAQAPQGRFALLRGNIKTVEGRRGWFPPASALTPNAYVMGVENAANEVLEAMESLFAQIPMTSSIYIVGFGQGATLAYLLAARSKVLKVLAISGDLPAALRPGDDVTTGTYVWAVHGTNDTTVPFVEGQATAQSFIGKTPSPIGWTAVAGGLHSIQSMQSAAGGALTEVMASASLPLGGYG